MILHLGVILSLMGILSHWLPYVHSSLITPIQGRPFQRLISGFSCASKKDEVATSIIPTTKKHTVGGTECHNKQLPQYEFGSTEIHVSFWTEENETEADSTRSVAESTGADFQDADTKKQTTQSRELLNEWYRELQAGFQFIENHDEELWEIISALPVFEVIPWLFALSISSEIHIVKLGENDWSLMNRFPDKLLRNPEYFKTLPSEFSVNIFPSLLKARSSLDYIEFGLEVELMNNRVNQELLNMMQMNPEIVPKLLKNSFQVNSLIDKSYKNFYETTRMVPIDHVKRLTAFSADPKSSRLWTAEFKAYSKLKAATKKRKEIYKKLERSSNLSEVREEIKSVKLFEIMQRISNLIVCKQIYFKYLERINVPARLKKISNFAGSDGALSRRLETFDFSFIQEVQSISDLSQYETDLINLQISAQRQLLSGILDGLKNDNHALLLQALTSVLHLVPGVVKFKTENPTYSLNALDHLEVLKVDFHQIWPLKPLFQKQKQTGPQNFKSNKKSLLEIKPFLGRKK